MRKTWSVGTVIATSCILALTLGLFTPSAHAGLFGPRVVVVPSPTYYVVSPAPVVTSTTYVTPSPVVTTSYVPTTIVAPAPVYRTRTVIMPTTSVIQQPASYVVPAASVIVRPAPVQYVAPRSWYIYP